MPSDYLAAIDIGSSRVHCLITNRKGQVISSCHQEWTFETPPDIAPLGRVFNPYALWKLVCDGIRKSLKDAGIGGGDIAGVSATSQREGMVLLDKSGQVLYAGPNIDLRALMEGMSLDSEFGKHIYGITGHTPSFLFAPAKLKWFETNQPGIYKKIATVLTISDWLIFKLCGERVSEVSGAAELGLIDLRKRNWSDNLRTLLGLPQGIYPALLNAGIQAGWVTAQSAADTGLFQNTPVAMGAPDTQCGLIGMDIKTGQTGIVTGWSAPVQRVTDQPVFDPEARIWTGCHALPRMWILESNAGEAGNAYRWLREIMFSQNESDEEIYRLMDNLARQSPAGADGALAFIGPAVMDMNNLGLKYGGFLFPIPLSATNSIDKSHLIRAAQENLCFAIKANCHQIEEISGHKIDEITIGGGMSRSRLLAEILSSVLDIPVSVPAINDISGLGAAMCAAAGSGMYSTLAEAIDNMKPRCSTFEPDTAAALEYNECYQRWISVSESLSVMSEEL